MPHFKTVEFKNYYRMGMPTVEFKVKINAKGLFYCNLSDEFRPAIETAFDANWELNYRRGHEGEIIATAQTFEKMMERLNKMLDIYSTPDETREPVIKYLIDSEITFAYNATGEVFSDPSLAGTETEWSDNEKYGHTGRFTSSSGGYNLRIGAKAETKITQKFGGREKIIYEPYVNESVPQEDDPAFLLNSWRMSGFEGHSSEKEIPYSDEAALFFHNMLLGMAKLSKMIQESTFDQVDLMKVIETGNGLLQIEAPNNID